MDDPNIFVSWGIGEQNLVELFKEHNLKHVTTGYYTTTCTSLGSLTCALGFHFEPRTNGRLNELEFFRRNNDDQKKSFEEFQTSFVNAFGKPTNIRKGDAGFNDYRWIIGGVQIVHFVFDRFGPEEHTRIKIYL